MAGADEAPPESAPRIVFRIKIFHPVWVEDFCFMGAEKLAPEALRHERGRLRNLSVPQSIPRFITNLHFEWGGVFAL